MDIDTVVRALRRCNNSKGNRCSSCPVFSRYDYKICKKTVDRFAVDLIESLQARVSEKDAEIKRLNDEPPAYKFYYCESENSYLLGRRVGNFYYAHWHDGVGFVFDMSRYLPWGEHVVALRTAWKEHTYPSEPKEIDSSEWFNGFLAQRLSASQRRADAAVEDMVAVSSGTSLCTVCTKKIRCWTNARACKSFEWRGPQEAEKGENNA